MVKVRIVGEYPTISNEPYLINSKKCEQDYENLNEKEIP